MAGVTVAANGSVTLGTWELVLGVIKLSMRQPNQTRSPEVMKHFPRVVLVITWVRDGAVVVSHSPEPALRHGAHLHTRSRQNWGDKKWWVEWRVAGPSMLSGHLREHSCNSHVTSPWTSRNRNNTNHCWGLCDCSPSYTTAPLSRVENTKMSVWVKII